MAVQQVKVYRCNVSRVSAQHADKARGEEVVVISTTSAGAQAVVQALYGADLLAMTGPVLAMTASTTMTGS
jgi:hypothetical protein